MHSPINVVMKQQRDGAINKAYGHTQTGLQACSRSSLSASLFALQPVRRPACSLSILSSCLPADRHACLPACRQVPTGKQAYRQTCQQTAPPTGRFKYNMERHGIKRGSALDFRQQDGQQMYNNEKMFDFLYFSEE